MKKVKILVVDDNQDFLDLVSDYLAENDYDVLRCINGKDAHEKFSDYNPAIVLTDVVMPEFDGIELLVGLRKVNPNVKIIVMSGGNRGYADSYLEMAKDLGANTILNKPFELSELLAQIKILENTA